MEIEKPALISSADTILKPKLMHGKDAFLSELRIVALFNEL